MLPSATVSETPPLNTLKRKSRGLIVVLYLRQCMGHLVNGEIVHVLEVVHDSMPSAWDILRIGRSCMWTLDSVPRRRRMVLGRCSGVRRASESALDCTYAQCTDIVMLQQGTACGTGCPDTCQRFW